ncbi:MAG: tRNA pseudouridine(55) synthase TruB, partial [Candidatus Gracilibacteria bacterium]|nr:tRNA pseudouridine(55) synthase TruB [Candidatus Gracilibacteria bacterium]
MDCFYLIDKPIGITSFDVLRKLKKILNIKKMGHTGTLDPLATGLLLVAIGNYTKLIPYFEKDTKEYEFKINLDGISSSFDCESEITYISDEKKQYFKNNLKLENIKNILDKYFTGKIFQMPPKYSALKIGGKKAVDMVRNGEEFELKSREITIYNIEVLDFNYPEIYLKAKVSAGTYIRSIAQDLGEILKTGGYITYLRRTEIGKLNLSFSQTLDNFDILKKLDEEILFSKDKFIKLDFEKLKDIDNGKIINNNLINLKDNQEYFVKNEN